MIDHTVTLKSGAVVENALRVIPNGDGAEVMFVLLRQPQMKEADFEADARHVEADLKALKGILENDNAV